VKGVIWFLPFAGRDSKPEATGSCPFREIPPTQEVTKLTHAGGLGRWFPSLSALWNYDATVALSFRGDAMIGTLIGVLLVLVFLGVCWWGIQQLLPLVPMGEPFATIVRVILVVILALVVIWIITILLGAAGIHVNTFGFR
jgi:hypothetical protein